MFQNCQNTRVVGGIQTVLEHRGGLLRWLFTGEARLAMVQNGRADKSTLPPEKIMPSFGCAPSGRWASPRLATAPGLRSGAMATADDGSMMIFMRSQTVRMAALISSSLATS